MTATITDQGTGTPTGGATGRVSRVIGPVIDAEFPANAMPEIYNALTTEIDLNGQRRTVTFEVAQHLGDNMVRAISLQSTDGLVRGTDVVDTGAPISVPVGDAVKGHIFNVLGESLEQGGTSFDSLYVDVNGQSGYFSRHLAVYGQVDRPCPRCGTPIRRESFMNRSSYSCPRCQPRPRARRG